MQIERWTASSPAAWQEGLVDVLVAAVEQGASISWARPLSVEQARTWWAGVLPDPAKHVLVAADGDRVLGTVTLAVPWQTNAPHRAEVQMMVVHPKARRRGVARALLLELEARAAALGRPALMLDTTPGLGAHALYLSCGWREVGVVEDYARDENGVRTPTVFMERRLDRP